MILPEPHLLSPSPLSLASGLAHLLSVGDHLAIQWYDGSGPGRVGDDEVPEGEEDEGDEEDGEEDAEPVVRPRASGRERTCGLLCRRRRSPGGRPRLRTGGPDCLLRTCYSRPAPDRGLACRGRGRAPTSPSASPARPAAAPAQGGRDSELRRAGRAGAQVARQ